MEDRDLAIDRISDLPDPLITQILSLLTTIDAVRTCMLSKRWIDLSTSVATLDFDYCISGFDSEDKFLRFVDGVLKRRGFSPLDNFKLIWQSKPLRNHGIVQKYINHAVACMPRVIYIHMDTDRILNLPCCGSVKEMSLLYGCTSNFNFRSILGPISINLPSLQKLDLGHILISNGWIKILLLGCPVLEELALSFCWLIIDEINSNVLKKFTIKKGYFSNCVKSFTMKDTPSLVAADLEISHAGEKFNLLGGLPNVTSLRLYRARHYLKLFEKYIPNCPILNNLRSLELGELTMRNGWNLVACFLQHSPNLNKLVLNFHHKLFEKYIPNCPILNNLRSLELGELTMRNGWNLVACFLRHSPNLKKLVLNFHHESEVTAQKALPGKFLFRHEFLEIVEIKVKEGSEETIKKVVTTLGAFVKTIGKIVIL